MPKIIERTEGLSVRDWSIAHAMKTFMLKKHYMPRLKELEKEAGLSFQDVSASQKALAKAGWLARSEETSGMWVATHEVAYVAQIPVVDKISKDMFTIKNQKKLPFIPYAPAKDGKYFGLRIKNTALDKWGILKGDIVFVRYDGEAQENDLVVALTDDKTVCRKYTVDQQTGKKWLQSSNSRYKPIELYTDDQNCRRSDRRTP